MSYLPTIRHLVVPVDVGDHALHVNFAMEPEIIHFIPWLLPSVTIHVTARMHLLVDEEINSIKIYCISKVALIPWVHTE